MQCDFCQEEALHLCKRCGKHACAIHLRALNQNEVVCEECATNVLVCLKEGHRWGEWQLTEAEPCSKTRVCSRCHEKEVDAEHNWVAVTSQTTDVCVYFVCNTCGTQMPVAHRYKPAGPRSEAYICQICGHVRRRVTVY